MFQMPEYRAPDFSSQKFLDAPDVKWKEAVMDGVAPEALPQHVHVSGIF